MFDSVESIGFLKLGGELFSNTSDAYSTGKLNEVEKILLFLHIYLHFFIFYFLKIHKRINREMIEHLKKCPNGGVVLFDEIQKVVPGTLNVILTISYNICLFACFVPLLIIICVRI